MHSTPGIYLQALQPMRVARDLLRSDITGFIGYARQGPVRLPVRLETWSQFIAVFGQPLHSGHLGLAVKAFFENGGITCYVLRLADPQAAAAHLRVPSLDGLHIWDFYAAFRPGDVLTSVDAAQRAGQRPDPALLHNLAPGEAKQPVPNPGQWGNSLSLSLRRSSRLSTRISGLFDDGYASWLENLVGLEAHSTAVVSQQQDDGSVQQRILAIESVDLLRQKVTWREPLLPQFSGSAPLRLDTVEWDLTLLQDNRQVEYWPGLALHPQHSQHLCKVLAQRSQYLHLQAPAHFDPLNSGHWPQTMQDAALNGGADGLAQINAEHYLQAVQILAQIDDIGLVAAPDLVLRGEFNPPSAQPTPPQHNCRLLQPPRLGSITGTISDGHQPLRGVTITDAGSGRFAVSDASGGFTITDIDADVRTLRLRKAGFDDLEQQVLAGAHAEPTQFTLTPVAQPRNLEDQEILWVQQAMGNPLLLGTYRMALLDAPRANMRLDDIRNWRAQLGDTACAALFYPWLAAPTQQQQTQTLHPMPPSGHIAGLFARADLTQGPHHPPANSNMRFVKRLLRDTHPIEHGLLNSEGINLLRQLPGQGIRLMGARTLSSAGEWRYINVRRLVYALQKTLEKTLQWAVFENNTTLLRQAVSLSTNTLLDTLWRAGALAGNSAAAAYSIKCDTDNNPADQRDQGKFLLEIAVAPSVPFEFIHIRFGKTLDAIEVTE